MAVSKTRTSAAIRALYDLGHRDFGENYVQELVAKAAELPPDIRWHFIGHLQTNKVKQVVPLVQLIHGVDSLRLLQAIDRESRKAGRTGSCLLQVHIAREETKFGLNESELMALVRSLPEYGNVVVKGLMGMASLTEDRERIRAEFRQLKGLFDRCNALGAGFTELSMGMSADYDLAIEAGSTMVRIGSLLFGERGKNQDLHL